MLRYETNNFFFSFVIVRLPENISLPEGAVVEPLACAIWACKRARVSMGKTIFICGGGERNCNVDLSVGRN